MIFRIIGAALFPLCGWLAGDSLRQKTDRHLQALMRVLELFQRIRQEIEFRRADLQQLYQRLLRENLLPQSQEAQTLQQIQSPAELSAAEQQCFAECMKGLGKTEAQQECERLDYYIARFQEYQKTAQQAAQKQADLPQKLGLAAGAVLALMFL